MVDLEKRLRFLFNSNYKILEKTKDETNPWFKHIYLTELIILYVIISLIIVMLQIRLSWEEKPMKSKTLYDHLKVLISS